MREDKPIDDGAGRHRRAEERWHPFARHLVNRFTADGDEAMTRAAVAAILDTERRLGSERPDFLALVVPPVISVLRRHRRETACGRMGRVPSVSALQLAIMIADTDLSRRLRRSPTVAEVATHLDVSHHQVLTGLEAGWAGRGRPPAGGEKIYSSANPGETAAP